VANNGALYGIIGALGVVVVGGGLYIANQQGAFGPATSTAALTAPAPVPAAPPPAAKPPVASPPVVVVEPCQVPHLAAKDRRPDADEGADEAEEEHPLEPRALCSQTSA